MYRLCHLEDEEEGTPLEIEEWERRDRGPVRKESMNRPDEIVPSPPLVTPQAAQDPTTTLMESLQAIMQTIVTTQ